MHPFVLIRKLVNKMCQHFCFMIWQLLSSSLALDDYFILICFSIKYLELLIPTTIIIIYWSRLTIQWPPNWNPTRRKKLLILTVLLDTINILGNIHFGCWHLQSLKLHSIYSTKSFWIFFLNSASSSFCSWVLSL
jgi:hypothetical protein